MKQILFLLVVALSTLNTNAQFNNNYWKIGRHVGLNFTNLPPVVNIQDNCPSFMNITNTSFCDIQNKLIFYSNACRVYNRNDQVMPNDRNFNHGTISNTYINTDYNPLWKGAVIIPFPNDTNKFYMFYGKYGLDY